MPGTHAATCDHVVIFLFHLAVLEELSLIRMIDIELLLIADLSFILI